MKVDHENASKYLSEGPPKASPGTMVLQSAELIRAIHIQIPPLLGRSIDHLYLLDDAGPTLLQLVSVILQYNDLVDTLTRYITKQTTSFAPTRTEWEGLSGHLTTIGQLLHEAEQKVAAIHDEAVPARC